MRSVGIKYGLICGLVYVIIGLVSILFGLNDGSTQSGMISALVGVVMLGVTFYVIYLGIKEFRDDHNEGGLTLGEAIKLGVLIALIAGVLAALFNLLYFNVISPGYLEEQFEMAREQMEDQGMKDEQIDLTLKITRIMQSPPVAILWTTFWGLIKALIAGAILKKDKPVTA